MADTPTEETQQQAPAGDTSGVTDTGTGLSYTPTAEDASKAANPEAPAPAADRPTEWPEGVNSWEEFGKLSPEDRSKALLAQTKVETQGTEQEAPKEGLDLLVQQQTAGMSPELATAVTPFIRNFAEKGDLTADEVKDAAKATGLSEAIVQQYVDNAKIANAANLEAETKPFTSLAGGPEEYAKFQEWAATALGPDDHGKINAALDANKPADMAYAVDLWKASGNGPAPRDLTTQARTMTPGSDANQGGYSSSDEMRAAMADPRYEKDATYRKEVERRTGLMQG